MELSFEPPLFLRRKNEKERERKETQSLLIYSWCPFNLFLDPSPASGKK
jgi:hypothetical protein